MAGTYRNGVAAVCVLLVSSSAVQANFDDEQLLLADSIVSIVQGPEGANVITQSDLLKPGIDGQMRTIEELERDFQMFQDACRLKVADPNDEDSIDSYLNQIQTANNLSDEDIEQIFKQSGRTIDEGRKELQRMHAVSQIISHKVHRNVMVTPAEVETYCVENPINEPAQFTFRIAYISSNEYNAEQLSMEPIAADALSIELDWSKELSLVEEELAEHLTFLKHLQPGQVHIQVHGDGYIAGHLVAAQPTREVPVKERYAEVEALLRQEKFPALLAQYYAELDTLFIVTRLSS